MAPKMAQIVETVNPNDSEDEQFEDEHVATPEGQLGQDTQHSQDAQTEHQEGADNNDSDADSDKKPAATNDTLNEENFDTILDTFVSKTSTAQTMWNSEIERWDNTEELGIAIQNSNDPTKFK